MIIEGAFEVNLIQLIWCGLIFSKHFIALWIFL